MSALAEALAAAQAELPLAVGRDSQGTGYRYTSLDKLIAETRPAYRLEPLDPTETLAKVRTAIAWGAEQMAEDIAEEARK